MFDTTAEIVIKARTSQGIQTLELRWPSDEEWIARAKGRKILVNNLGRGMRETTIESGAADLKLYDKVKVNGAPQVSPAEATRLVDVLAACEVLDVAIEGDEATVHMIVLGGAEVTHRCRIPSAEQVKDFRRAAFRLYDLRNGKQQMTMNLDPGARLWDACGGKSDDYKGPVPALHKDACVRAVIEFLDQELGVKAQDDTF